MALLEGPRCGVHGLSARLVLRGGGAMTTREDAPSAPLADHGWLGDEDGHNCETCKERGDALYLCWPQKHLCDYCEEVSCAWPDVFCEECRAIANAVMDTADDPVERLLSAHGRMEPLCTEDVTMCRCGASFSGGPGYHRRHLAELIHDALGTTPTPWAFGERSPSRKRFDENGRIKPDA